MQMFSTQLASNQPMTLLAGVIGSHIFVFVLTVSVYLYLQGKPVNREMGKRDIRLIGRQINGIFG